MSDVKPLDVLVKERVVGGIDPAELPVEERLLLVVERGWVIWSTDPTIMSVTSVGRVEVPEVVVNKWGVWDSELPKFTLVERVLWVCKASDIREGLLSVKVKMRLDEMLSVVARGWVLWNVEPCMVSVDKGEVRDAEPSDETVEDRVMWDDESRMTPIEVRGLLGEIFSVVVT